MDATITRLATPAERRELRALCRVGFRRERFDRVQSAAVVGALLIAGYVPILSLILAIAHVR